GAQVVRALQFAAIRALVERLDLERVVRTAHAPAGRRSFSLRDSHRGTCSLKSLVVFDGGPRPSPMRVQGRRLGFGHAAKARPIAIFRGCARSAVSPRRVERYLQAMLRSLLAAAVLAASIAGPSHAQTVTTDAGRAATAGLQALPVHVGGRVRAEPRPGGGKRFEHEWPGIYFEAGFRGDRVVLRFDDPSNEYRLFIDNLEPVTLAQPGTAAVTVSDLALGPHRLRLEKVTVSIDRPAAFEGFVLL